MKASIKAIKYYTYYDKFELAHKMHIRMRFADRLKFLFFGEKCTFYLKDEQASKRAKEGLESLRRWIKEQEKSN